MKTKIEKKCMIAFHELNTNPSCDPAKRDTLFRRDYNDSLNTLKISNNVFKLPYPDNTKEKVQVFPTYSATDSLKNSLHVDVEDFERSCAVFYQHQKEGEQYLVFPKYGLAV